MKKSVIMVILITLLMILVCPIAANASDMDYTQSTSLSYTVQGNFMIYIPAEINVGNTVMVTAGEMNIPNNKAVEVSLGGLDLSNSIHLTNDTTEDVVNVFFTRENGERYTYDNNIIGVFEAGSEGSSYEIGTEVEYAAGVTRAGTYTGNVDFYICYIDK